LVPVKFKVTFVTGGPEGEREVEADSYSLSEGKWWVFRAWRQSEDRDVEVLTLRSDSVSSIEEIKG
jgi:hypothetical protein